MGNPSNSRNLSKQNETLQLTSWLRLVGSIAGWLIIQSNPLKAQITPDGTVGTEVNTTDNVTEITGGTKADSNLFHSFGEFSLSTGGTAFFNNATDVSNIVGRVTGGNISNIDGLIRANGNANLILINPNGISFGANAQLDIGGSFLSSSADSVVFADGTVFGVNNSQVDPILTVSVPVGLQLGQNSGSINVTGNGHNLTVAEPLFSPITFGQQSGLRVKPEQTLALVAGEINFDGGTVAAPGGKVELGSVAEGLVSLDFSDAGLNLGYANVTAFENIQLRSQSLADVTGTDTLTAGSIQVQGRQVSLNDGSLFLAQNRSAQTAGNINVSASESVTVNDTNDDGTLRSSITNEAIAGGNGGNINISTERLTVDKGGTIIAKTASTAAGSGGNIKINASESVGVNGSSNTNFDVTSSIITTSFGSGDSGNNSITTNALNATNGGTIAATAFSTGNGGDVSISANSIELVGVEPNVFTPSAISASTLGKANAGNLTIDTSNLTLLEGGRIDASTAAAGNAGNITINATDSITIDGTVPESINPSLIIASANILDPVLSELLMISELPSGNSGNINLTTSQLDIMVGGQLTVRNDGLGDAGALNVSADNIALNSRGGISAATQNGQGGNLSLEANNISLSGGSQISNANFGAEDGGITSITTDNLTISDRSFINSTTFGEGDGGNVALSAANISLTGTGFIEFRDNFQTAALTGTLTPEDLGTGIFVGTAATGTGGDLTVDTQSLSLSEGAIIFSPVFTQGTGGNMNINADDIDISASALQMGTAGVLESSSSGNINLDAQRLEIRDGGTIVNTTLGNASAGNINIFASESIDIQDTPVEALTLSGIYANTFGTGAGGNININTTQLRIIDGLIGSNTGGVLSNGSIINTGGQGGNIDIQARNRVQIGGIPANPAFTSGIGTSTYSDSDAGNLKVSTARLVIEDGADFATATLGMGKGGQLTIDATESIKLIGNTTPEGDSRGGLLATSGREEFPNLQATGTAGNINVTTSELTVSDGASIDAQSRGVGDAGVLAVKANNISLSNAGGIIATSQVGKGGNINLEAQNKISLNGGSRIASDNFGRGAGGTVNIITNILEISDRSQISTTTFAEGDGGNISIGATDINIIGTGFKEFQDNFQTGILNGSFEADLGTGIFIGTTTTGKSGSLAIDTDSLNLTEGSVIFSALFESGRGGSITVDAKDIGINASAIQGGGGGASVSSSGAGDFNLNTERLIVEAGGTISNGTLGDAAGGNVNITATDFIELKNSPSNTIVLTGISSNTFSGSGTGGNINIETGDLSIDDAIIASTTGLILNDDTIVPVGGLGGNINIKAKGKIEAQGIPFNPLLESGVSTSSFSSSNAGNITISTEELVISKGAGFSSVTLGAGNSGEISIDATDSVELIGTTTIKGMNRGGLLATSGRGEFPNLTATGTAGNINLTTPELTVSDGASIDVQSLDVGNAGNITIDTDTVKLDRGLINTSVLGEGVGGNIKINANDSVEVIGSGFDSLQQLFFSQGLPDVDFLDNLISDIESSPVTEGIIAITLGDADAGSIEIDTANLQISEGGLVATTTGRNGTAGSIFLNVAENFEIDNSIISSSTLFAGQGGDIDINTKKMKVLAGSQITTSTLGSGNSGNLTINASESITVAGATTRELPSNIAVGAQPLPTSTGNGGDLTITTTELNIDNGGVVSVNSTGTGDAGTLFVNAEQIFLDNRSSVIADTQSGGGANIVLDADNIFWLGGSSTTARAVGTGNGGNITIDANNLVALEGSRLQADAIEGNGGNIQIDTEGLFICQTCQVTASSELGVDGVVQIETLQPNTQLEVSDIPTQPTQPQETVAVACPGNAQANTSELTITGRGGLPPRPQELLNSPSLVTFAQPNSQIQPTSNSETSSKSLLPAPARSWHVNSQGTVVLSARASETAIDNSFPTTHDCNVNHKPLID